MADYQGTFIQPTNALNSRKLKQFIDAALAYRNKSEWKGDKRIFVTLFPHKDIIGKPNYLDVLNSPIRTRETGSYPNSGAYWDIPGDEGPRFDKNLSHLSTGEIQKFYGPTTVQLSINQKLNQYYNAVKYSNAAVWGGYYQSYTIESAPTKFETGSFCISKMNDDNPSLLVELNKEQQLPNGTGDKEFIVIPKNLHPFIKDNLAYFLTKAGIDIGGNASPLIELNESRRKLK